jgi:hypothetical protein
VCSSPGGALERAVDDLLGQESYLDVPVLGAAGQEGERLVTVDAVALHEDADRGADVGAGVQRHAELLDLVGIAEQGRGLGGEELGQLHRRTVEGACDPGVQVEPGGLLLVQQQDPRLSTDAQRDRLGAVVGEPCGGRQVVDQDGPLLGDRGVTGTFAQLVLQHVGLLGHGVGRRDGAQRSVLGAHRDADEVRTRHVVGGRGGQGLQCGSTGGTRTIVCGGSGQGLLDPANVETAARPHLPGDFR